MVVDSHLSQPRISMTWEIFAVDIHCLMVWVNSRLLIFCHHEVKLPLHQHHGHWRHLNNQWHPQSFRSWSGRPPLTPPSERLRGFTSAGNSTCLSRFPQDQSLSDFSAMDRLGLNRRLLDLDSGLVSLMSWETGEGNHFRTITPWKQTIAASPLWKVLQNTVGLNYQIQEEFNQPTLIMLVNIHATVTSSHLINTVWVYNLWLWQHITV